MICSGRVTGLKMPFALNDWKTSSIPWDLTFFRLAKILENGNEEPGRALEAIELYAGFSRGRQNAFIPLEARLFGNERKGIN